jgi:hypothetical protein
MEALSSNISTAKIIKNNKKHKIFQENGKICYKLKAGKGLSEERMKQNRKPTLKIDKFDYKKLEPV